MTRQLGLALASVFVTACGSHASVTPPVTAVDPLSRQLLAEHEIVAAGSTTTQAVRIATDVNARPLYLEVSRRIGLDFRPHVGRTAESCRWVARQPPLRGRSKNRSIPGARAAQADS